MIKMCLLSAAGLAAISSSVFASKGPVASSELEANSSALVNSTVSSHLSTGAVSDWEGTVFTFRSELPQINNSVAELARPGIGKPSPAEKLNYSHATGSSQSNWSDFESSVISFTATAPTSPKIQIVAPKLSAKRPVTRAILKSQTAREKQLQVVNSAVSTSTVDAARALKSADNKFGISAESTIKQLQLVASSIESTVLAAPTIAAVHLLRLAVPNFEGLTEGNLSDLDAQVESVNETILSCPVTNSIVTSDYGIRTHPITGKRHLHNGVDFSAEANQPVHALLDGTVIKCGRRGALGIAVEIYHPSVEKSTIVGHLNGVAVKKGEVIKQNQIIGYAGSTGRSTGVHVHFMVGGIEGYEDPNNFLAWLNENRTALANGESVTLPTIIVRASRPNSTVVTASDSQNSTVNVKPIKVKSHGRVVTASAWGSDKNSKVASSKNEAAVVIADKAKIAAKAKTAPKITEAQVDAARDTLTEKQRLAEMFEYLYKEGAVSRNQVQEQVAEARKAQETVQNLEANRKG